MDFYFKKNNCETNIYEDVNGLIWNYINENMMTELYPNGGFTIIGDYRCFVKNVKDKENNIVLEDDVLGLDVFSLKLKKREFVLGFVMVTDENGNEAYVRLIQRKKSKWWIWLILLLICVFFGIYYFNNKSNKDLLDNTAIAYNYDGLVNNDSSQIAIPVFTDLYASADGKIVANFPNPNGNPCYFQYSLFIDIDDVETKVYESKLIMPKTAIPVITMNKTLKKGDYNGKISISTYSLDNPSIQLNGGEVEIKLHVRDEDK